ncbi:MAG: MotA/TolQ/ExbB proton channel family protein [Acidobacteria bacterium]|nr:MotA/TolQ/ExbB proton channel family protein [Acidobacteriota bacterium]
MKRIDWTIWLGFALGISAILFAAWFEDLKLGFLWNPTAAMIVFGGTLGAVIVRRGLRGVISAGRAVWKTQIIDDEEEKHKVEIAKLAWLSRSAQKNGVKAFENYADNSGDPLIAQGLILVADCAHEDTIKQILGRQLDSEDEAGLQDSATLEAAGGFAPTFGILGAVMGLIGVLRVLDRPEVLGVGIATAFVATIYGIGLANLFFFPLSARLRARHEANQKRREELVSVILAINTKQPPRTIINQFNLPK